MRVNWLKSANQPQKIQILNEKICRTHCRTRRHFQNPWKAQSPRGVSGFRQWQWQTLVCGAPFRKTTASPGQNQSASAMGFGGFRRSTLAFWRILFCGRRPCGNGSPDFARAHWKQWQVAFRKDAWAPGNARDGRWCHWDSDQNGVERDEPKRAFCF